MIDINNMSSIEIMAINKMYLENKINKLENALAEKDKEIKELKQQQLYKEDFEKIKCLERDYEGGYIILKGDEMLILIDNSKYDKLPSKEMK